MSDKPLFIPLRREYYDVFVSGQKTVEYRQYGPRWNERTCLVGRDVTISLGYGTAHRRSGVITGFEVLPMPSNAISSDQWRSIFGKNSGTAACITIKLEEKP